MRADLTRLIEGDTHGTYFHLIPLKVVLRERGKQENYLCFDNGVDVRAGGAVHGWSASPG